MRIRIKVRSGTKPNLKEVAELTQKNVLADPENENVAYILHGTETDLETLITRGVSFEKVS